MPGADGTLRPGPVRRLFPRGARIDRLAVAAVIVLFVTLHGVWFMSAPGDLDAFNFALGVREFDVARHRPHPPGAPVYIVAGKVATWAWERAGLPADGLAGPESAALAALSLAAGALSIFLSWAVLRRVDPFSPRARRTALLIGSAPLLWMLAVRPLSDVVGLALVLGAYWFLARDRLRLAAVLSGIAVGLRVQTTFLTLPVIALMVWRRRSRTDGVAAGAWFAAGVFAWLVPLVAATGGVRRYWAALTAQGADDMASPVILAATPTVDNAVDALFNSLVRPWGAPELAWLILAAAAVGGLRLYRTAPRHLFALMACAAPYALFHFAFQETATIRYALPIVVAFAYLAAVAVETAPRAWQPVVTTVLVATSLAVSVPAAQSYSQEGGPAMALFRAMYARAALAPPAFVTGHWNLMLPHLQDLVDSPPWRVLDPKPGEEWQGTIDHWTRGETAAVWFIADPKRTDGAQFDRRARSLLGEFTLKEQATWILNGLRPKALDWWELRPPAWIAMRGFALTPEVGGQSAVRREGPAFRGAVALVRRFDAGAVMTVGGRHVGGAADPAARVAIDIDGRPVWTGSASAGSRGYAALVHLVPEDLAGSGVYATATIRSTAKSAGVSVVPVTVEDFDYQSADGVVAALTSGWYEPELDTASGRTWRWSGPRASLLVHRRRGDAVVLSLEGTVPPEAPFATIQVSAGGHVVDVFTATGGFFRAIVLPASEADACDVDVIITSDFSFAPHDRDARTPDRRELALKFFNIEATARPHLR